MARSYTSDPLMSFNFALIDMPVAGIMPIAFPYKLIKSAITNGTFVGMKSISIPTMSMNTKQIQEGTWPIIHNIHTGYSYGGECTLTQAVLPLALDMYLWVLQAINSRVAPRRHFAVAHLRQDKKLPSRLIMLRDCIPTRWEASTQLDADQGTVCMESLTMNVGRVEVIPVPIAEFGNGDL